MRDSYLEAAKLVISDPYVLVNVVSRRVKQLRRGSRPLVESLERLPPEDVALREIAEGKISYEIPDAAELLLSAGGPPVRPLGGRYSADQVGFNSRREVARIRPQ